MAERSTITQVVQVGLETTAGTKMAATKRLQALDIKTGIKFKIDKFRPTGYKVPTVTATEEEWVDTTLTGQPTYTEILWPLSGLIGIPSAPTTILDGSSADTGGRRWIFEPSPSSPDTPQTMTFEQGSSVRAHSYGYHVTNELALSIARDKCSLSGKGFAQALTDGITMSGARTVTDGVTNSTATVTSATAKFVAADVGIGISGTGIPASTFIGIVNSATSIGLSSSATANTPVNATASGSGVTLAIASNVTTVPLVPITGAQFTVYADTTYGGLGGTKLGRLFSADPLIGDRFNPLWVLDASLSSFAAAVEKENTNTFKMTVEADSAGMAFLAAARTNTTYFLRILANGPVIYNSAAPYISTPLTYSFQWDKAVQIENTTDFGDYQGAYFIGFDFLGVADGAWGKSDHIEVVNKIKAMT